MSGTVLGKITCGACSGAAEVREGKAGGLTIYCTECKTQGFAKTPKAAAALRAKLSGGGAPAVRTVITPAVGTAADDFGDAIFGAKK